MARPSLAKLNHESVEGSASPSSGNSSATTDLAISAALIDLTSKNSFRFAPWLGGHDGWLFVDVRGVTVSEHSKAYSRLKQRRHSSVWETRGCRFHLSIL